MMTQKQRQMVFGMALIAAVGVLTAQISIPNTFTPNTRVVSANVNANFSTLGANALNRTGGTMTGTLTAANVLPDGHNTRDIGATATRFRDGWFGRNLGVTGDFTIESVSPGFWLDKSNAAADNQLWRIATDATGWYLQAFNDALTVNANPISVTRSGTTISSIALAATTTSTSAALSVGTTLGVTGTTTLASVGVGGGTAVVGILTGTATVDAPNLTAGTATTAPVTVTGATTASVCFAGVGVGTAGTLNLSARAVSANTVDVIVHNAGAGAVDLPSSSWRVTCFNY